MPVTVERSFLLSLYQTNQQKFSCGVMTKTLTSTSFFYPISLPHLVLVLCRQRCLDNVLQHRQLSSIWHCSSRVRCCVVSPWVYPWTPSREPSMVYPSPPNWDHSLNSKQFRMNETSCRLCRRRHVSDDKRSIDG